MSEIKYLKLKPDEDGDTILHFAAADDNYKLITTYIKHGANVDTKNHIGWTPLMIAVKNCHLKTTKILVYAGADTTKRNSYGVSVLSIAVSSGCLEIVKFLLRNNLNKSSYNCCSITPLVTATMCNNIDIIKHLLSQSYKIGKTEIGGLSPIFIASVINNREVLNVFQKYSRLVNCYEENENIIPTYKELPEMRIFHEFDQEKSNINLPETSIQKIEKKCSSLGAFDSFLNDFSPIFNIPDTIQFFPHLQHPQNDANYTNHIKSKINGNILNDNSSILVIPKESKFISVNEEEEYIDDVFENITSVSETKLENLYANIKEYAENKNVQADHSFLVKDLPKIPKFQSKSSLFTTQGLLNYSSNESRNYTKSEDWPVCNLRNAHRCRSSTTVFHPKEKNQNDIFQNISSVKSTSENENINKPQLFKIRKCTSLGCFDVYVKETELNLNKGKIDQNGQYCNPKVQNFIQNCNQLKNTSKVQNWLSTNVY